MPIVPGLAHQLALTHGTTLLGDGQSAIRRTPSCGTTSGTSPPHLPKGQRDVSERHLGCTPWLQVRQPEPLHDDRVAVAQNPLRSHRCRGAPARRSAAGSRRARRASYPHRRNPRPHCVPRLHRSGAAGIIRTRLVPGARACARGGPAAPAAHRRAAAGHRPGTATPASRSPFSRRTGGPPADGPRGRRPRPSRTRSSGQRSPARADANRGDVPSLQATGHQHGQCRKPNDQWDSVPGSGWSALWLAVKAALQLLADSYRQPGSVCPRTGP